MAYKPGSIRWIILPANIVMVITAAASAFLFSNQDYLAGWITALVCLVILFGIPDYSKRILVNINLILQSFDDDSPSKLKIPVFADELCDISEQMEKLKAKRKKTHETSKLNSFLVNDIIRHIPFALIVFDEEGKVYYINEMCNKLIGEPRKYLTAYPHESQMLITSWKGIEDGRQAVFSEGSLPNGNQLLISKKNFQFKDTTLTLLTLRSIRSELESQESDSWKKIIRVLNHEIMNSLTPVHSLTESIIAKNVKEADEKLLDLIENSLALISRRSKNLIDFVNKYKELNVIPKPDMKISPLDRLIEDTLKIFNTEISSGNINLSIQKSKEEVNFLADPSLMQQVFVNLITNSLEALKNTPSPALQVSYRNESATTVIEFTDNGCGISDNAKPNIFVPYFTTKKGGSGIGLALVKEIIRLHQGEITFTSIPRAETVFKIILPKTLN